MRRPCGIPWWLILGLCAGLAACKPTTDVTPATEEAGDGATRPAAAVRLLTRHLRDNRLDAFARDAVPPDLYAQLDTAWHAGHSRWPLDELPFSARLPQALDALSKPGAEAHWQQVFDRQFAHADGELKSTAATLGLFGAQYVGNEGDFSEGERNHYAQLIAATSRWGQAAPLTDPKRAHALIAQISDAARRTGIASDADLSRLGLDDSLRRLSPFMAAFKRGTASYGLDLDASLAGLDASLVSQTGDTAKVRMRYLLAGEPIDAVVDVERIDGRWYVSDFLRHARATAAKTTEPPGVAKPASAQPGTPPASAPAPVARPASA
jgi:hypothetical protein